MTLVLIIGGIDLSVGSVLGLCGAAAGLALVDFHLPFRVAILLSMGIGLLAGTLNGVISVCLGIPSFIVTLGMLEIARGLAYLTTHSQTKYIGSAVEGLSAPLAGIAVSPAFLIAVAIVVAGQVVLSRTVFGLSHRHWNERTRVRLAGINLQPHQDRGFRAGRAAGWTGRCLFHIQTGFVRSQCRRGLGAIGHRGGGHRRNKSYGRTRLRGEYIFWRAYYRHTGGWACSSGSFRTDEAGHYGACHCGGRNSRCVAASIVQQAGSAVETIPDSNNSS